MAPAALTVLDAVRAPRAEGPATVLAIGTATPANCAYQSDYPDYYFRVTNSDHLPDLKQKFKKICDRSTIRKRHMHLIEQMLEQNPSMIEYDAPSLDARQENLVGEIPKLGMAAAHKAIKEWGQPLSKVTHLVFCTRQAVDMPGADYQLMEMLGLNLSVRRIMLYQQGCLAGGTVLRVAKDLAENNLGACVLVVCLEIMAVTFRGPSARHILSEYGNMSSASVLFILDEMRKRSAEDGHATTGEGLDWGFLFGFGPGLTLETVVLHSVPIVASA